MELSVRSSNCLRAAEINTLAELVQKREAEMLKYRNFGRKSLKEIADVLEQIVGNLLSNAVKFTHEGEVVIRAECLAQASDHVLLRFAVRDTGIGISAADLPHIFEPFFTTKQDSGGVGLGLSISSKIVEEHGGTLHFDSEIGVGTTVEIMLPIERKK